MSDKVLILGAGGQVGQALTARAARAGFAAIPLTSAQADITDPTGLSALARTWPDCPIINASAYTAVDKAEDDRERAFAVNAAGPAMLAALFGQDRPVLHYSTDYVFDGNGDAPYGVDDVTAPLGVYGLSKRVGEEAVARASFGFVLRTAWVYSATGTNFLKTMVRVGRARGSLRVVDDQIGTPTHADDIADASLALLRAHLGGSAAAAPGLYHMTARGQTSWHGFAESIFAALLDQTGVDIGLAAIPTSEYPTPAKRPAYSVLDGSKMDAVPGVVRPDWQAPVAATVAAVLASE